MSDNRIKSLMKDFGYSDWEITAYFILIKYGPKTALELSRLSRIARPKTYEVITRLRKKGLVMKVPPMPTKGVTQKFVAIEPQKILKSKVNDIEELSILLQQVYKNPVNAAFPKVNMYTSKGSVKALILDLLSDSKYYLFYLSDLNIKEILGYSFDNILRSIKTKRNHFILRDTIELRNFSKSIKNYDFIDIKENMSYIITDNRVVLDLFKSQHIVIEIISTDAVNTFKEFYNRMLK